MLLIIIGLRAKDRARGSNKAELYCLSVASCASLILQRYIKLLHLFYCDVAYCLQLQYAPT